MVKGMNMDEIHCICMLKYHDESNLCTNINTVFLNKVLCIWSHSDMTVSTIFIEIQTCYNHIMEGRRCEQNPFTTWEVLSLIVVDNGRISFLQ